jgi:hypothetical protein
MKKLHFNEPVVPFLWLLVVICCLCPGAIASAEQQSNSQSVVNPAAEESIVVASIAHYTITKGELEKRLMTELHPYDYESYDENAEPADANTVLLKMVAEKAMTIEARSKDFLKKESISDLVKRFSEKKLVALLLQRYTEGKKINVTEDEITRMMEKNPKLDKARAKMTVESTKRNALINEYYKQIYSKSDVRKLSQNYPKAIQIHKRLLLHPKQPRKVSWIQNLQVREDLTEEEKSIVLAQYNSGKVTLKDWLATLCEIVPPRRPKDLNTPKGFDRLLERTLQTPLIVSEAKSLGLDRDRDFLKQVRDYEDRMLFSEALSTKRDELKEPTTDEILAYFAKNKELFGKSKSLKIDLIWCQDLKTAKQARAALDNGKDFEAVKQQYSLEKKVKAFPTNPSSEGLFWKDLWVGEPNQIIGPVKGFYREGIGWRVVKILEKKPGQEKPYSSDMDGLIKSRIMNQKNKALIAQYSEELLKKYPYKIYSERIKDIDPLDIP